MTYHNTGIILRSSDWKDYDKVFTVYTKKQGKVSLLARGVRRGKSKLNCKLQKFSELDFFLAKGRFFDIIAGVNYNKKFFKVRDNLISIGVISYIFELVEFIVKEGEPDEMLYDLLIDFVELINNILIIEQSFDNKKIEFVVFSTISRLLSLLGYHLSLDDCVVCRENIIMNNVFLVTMIVA